MLQHRGSAFPASTHEMPLEILNLSPAVGNFQFPAAGGPRGVFEELIAKRGRQGTRNPVPAPVSRIGARAAVRAVDTQKLQVGVAESVEQIEATNRLLRARYAWRGYSVEAFEHQVAPSRADAACREFTFFVADREGMLGTIKLRLDGPEGLAVEKTHVEAVQRARDDGRCIGELARLAIAEACDSRRVLASLFGLVYTVGRWVHGVTDVFIEVNPRHVVFYSRALGFAVVGEERFNEHVGTASVLLHLDVEILDEQLGFPNAKPADELIMRYGT
jgi:hypothetical protein